MMITSASLSPSLSWDDFKSTHIHPDVEGDWELVGILPVVSIESNLNGSNASNTSNASITASSPSLGPSPHGSRIRHAAGTISDDDDSSFPGDLDSELAEELDSFLSLALDHLQPHKRPASRRPSLSRSSETGQDGNRSSAADSLMVIDLPPTLSSDTFDASFDSPEPTLMWPQWEFPALGDSVSAHKHMIAVSELPSFSLDLTRPTSKMDLFSSVVLLAETVSALCAPLEEFGATELMDMMLW
ncbi:uncharacterized protein BJ171DRAFT_488494 [Polychytrium aggregatum]|uniref:uncharacterized protein n=1 Tax=Polychytrium aggregatum TaxID=110093 RepID=UPI0022FF4570|nr:uncharacterized protein BJ171DRAFT_488494 [Polychytrium aggregatum]KAI9209097.1 hypothetical protein BJ171DRAFT_488494 [Polychytrium aggregatum]